MVPPLLLSQTVRFLLAKQENSDSNGRRIAVMNRVGVSWLDLKYEITPLSIKTMMNLFYWYLLVSEMKNKQNIFVNQ